MLDTRPTDDRWRLCRGLCAHCTLACVVRHTSCGDLRGARQVAPQLRWEAGHAWCAQHISRGRGAPRRLCGRYGGSPLGVRPVRGAGPYLGRWSSVGLLAVMAAKVQGWRGAVGVMQRARGGAACADNTFPSCIIDAAWRAGCRLACLAGRVVSRSAQEHRRLFVGCMY